MFTASLGVILLGIVAAAGGGFVGAAIGGNFAFALTGFTALTAFGVSALGGEPFGSMFFSWIAFGPFMGPAVAFAGGAAAAAYAAHKGYIESGKDVTSPLAGLGKPDVLLVGAAFGIFGWVAQLLLNQIPWFGTTGHYDQGLVVVLSAIVARLMFGDSAIGKASITNKEKLLDKPNEKDGFMGVWDIDPESGNVWLDWQARPKDFIPIGIFFSIFASAAALVVAIWYPPVAGLAHTFTFAVSAVIILFLIIGFNMPVQHHITLIAGLGAVVFFPMVDGGKEAMEKGFAYYGEVLPKYINADGDIESKLWMNMLVAMVIGILWGTFSATLGEVFARIWYNRGTTHIDPPASTIWICVTGIFAVGAAMGFQGGFIT